MDEIHLQPYDPQWPKEFAKERDFIVACFSTPPLAIEHIGSTAVPGLEAKPIIDIEVLVGDLAHGHAAVQALEAGGYSYWRDDPDTARLYLVKGLPPSAPLRTHHLHIVADRARMDRHLRFRDALRANASIRKSYQALKADLAVRYRTDREAYTDAKAAFIAEVLEGIRPERSFPAAR